MTLSEKVKEAVKKAYQDAQAETAPPSFINSIADALEREADAYIYRQRKGIAPVVLAGLADKEAAKLRTDAAQAKAFWEKLKADRDSPESIERQAALAAAGALNFYSRAAMPALEMAEANYLRQALKLAALEAIADYFHFLQPSKEVLAAFRTEAARLTAQALAAELEAKASSAETGRAELGTIREAAADALDALGLIDDFVKFTGSKAQAKGLYLALLQRGYWMDKNEFVTCFKQWFGGEITARRLTEKTVSGDDAKDVFLEVIPKRRP